MNWLQRIQPGQVVIFWIVGVFLHFLVLFFVGRAGGEDGLTPRLVSNLAEIDSAQTATVETSLRLEREWLLAQYPDHGWEEIVLAQVWCRFGGHVPEWYICEPSVRVPQVESRIPRPDLNLATLALLASMGALVPIVLLAATVLWCLSTPFPDWGMGRLLGLWLSGFATLTLTRWGWVALFSETSVRLPTFPGTLPLPFLAMAAGIVVLLLMLTWRWLKGRTPAAQPQPLR